MEPVDGHHVTPRGRRIRADAVEWQASRSGGPGGQHANTSDTAVTVTIHVDRCGLPPVVQQRVLDTVGPVVVASSSRTRSQWRNRQLAWTEALTRLDEAAQPPPAPRARTRPSRGAREERLSDKRRAAERKRDRRRPHADD
ncbi:MAG: aminoacyl-tRNA hydrolase [Actinobacteria bacterium]|nr:aminoacyl-tRNA hydrolase [Actinomycetota bacterium]